MAPQKPKTSQWSMPWVAAVAILGCIAVVLAEQDHVLPISVWGLPCLALAAAGAAWIVSLGQAAPARTHLYRITTCLVAGGWATWAAIAGWTTAVWVALICSTVVLVALSYLCRTPAPDAEVAGPDPFQPAVREPADRRPARVLKWEMLLRRLTNNDLLRVVDLVPWGKPADGERIHVRLPLGMTWKDVAELTDKIQAALRLPPGCVVRVLDGAHQGEAVLDVMLRDCLVDPTTAAEDYSPASINDEFPILTTPRGEKMNICLRIFSMIIGGTTGAGKTTLLNRIILWLARCVDVLIWVIDLNGGGVAAPWIEAWALGKAKRPIVDWIADTEEEAAVMVAVGKAFAKERKTSAEARRRKKDAKSNVLPVDRDMPAVVILVDEGGEVQQAVSLLGQLVGDGISRIAQIGRAEGVRIVMSVLRGTSDLLSKALRVVSGIRLCLRMEEEDEYGHILGCNPGKTRLVHIGSAYLRRAGDVKPIFGRTDDMAPDAIERAAIACADLRPGMPDSGLRAAAKVRVRDVLGGRDPAGFDDIMDLPIMRDVEAGRAYEGRWERYAPKLAEMRGEELPEPEDVPEPTPTPTRSTVTPSAGSALAALTAAAGVPAPASPAKPSAPVDLSDKGSVDRAAAALLAEVDWAIVEAEDAAEPGAVRLAERAANKITTREHILAILNEAYPETLTSAQIGVGLQERKAPVSRQYRQDVLKQMREDGTVVQVAGAYTVRTK